MLRKTLLAPILCLSLFSPAALAQEIEPETTETAEAPLSDASMDDLFDRLGSAGPDDFKPIQTEIIARWAHSGSDTMDLLLVRGRDALSRDEHDKALSHFSRLIALEPTFAEGWNSRAIAHFIVKDYGRAMRDIRETLAREPRHFGALSGLGTILEAINEDERAFEAYERALEIHPNLDGPKDGLERLRRTVQGDPI